MKKRLMLDAKIIEHEIATLKTKREQFTYSIFQLENRLAKEKQGIAVIDGALQESEKLLEIAKANPVKKEPKGAENAH